MRREISRLGHAAKFWLAIFALGYIPLLWIGPSRVDEGWPGFIEILALWTVVGGAQLWIAMSQRVCYDDQQVCTRTLGRKRSECVRFLDIQSVSASHSWKRAAAIRPISELQIDTRDGRQILISLRHLSLSGLQEMVDEIHLRTGLAVPDLRKFVR